MERDFGRERREKAVKHANATLALEGLKVSAAAREDQEGYIRGQLSVQQLVDRATQRHKKN